LKVGVFVNASADFITRAATECGLDLLQFHGAETPEFCEQFDVQTMKAFQMRDAGSLEPLARYKTYAWLLDAWSPSRPGGLGERFDWDLALKARALGTPIFLAGGLTPENVAEAINQVSPYGVDVSSGVEARPEKKDHDKVRAFIRAARAAKPA
jgi:phosphoribosylanthranilate isomerase